MASLTNVHPSAGARTLLVELLRRLQRSDRPARVARPARRYYPPRRDRVIEDAAMAREMFHL